MAIPILPTSAPFTTEQRAYLNGFFAGLLGLEGSVTPVSTPPVNGTAPAAGHSDADSTSHGTAGAEETPWHDPNLPLDERMDMAQGKPLPLKLMAAMAQLDCGQCGYVCQTYAAAIADGSEKSLKKCVPGGKETATKLKELVAA